MDGGGSFSGRERNCAFLNLGTTEGKSFATASAATGLDHIDDSRAPAVCDWDGDGDLDIWTANRTAPMLRFLKNNTSTGDKAQSWIAFRLRGKTCNRDAIGARVVLTSGSGTIFSKTLKAGEGYLSQSSKWLHFGLGGIKSLKSCVVHWPGGKAENIPVAELNQRFTVAQGEGVAIAWQRPGITSTVSLPAGEISLSASPPPQSLSGARQPILPLPYVSTDGSEKILGAPGKITLVNLWASWCAPCIVEIKEFTAHEKKLRAAGIDILALSVDGLGDKPSSTRKDADRLLKRLGYPFRAGYATPALLERVHTMHQQSYGITRKFPVPTSLLVDAEGRLCAWYFGPVSTDRLLSDAGKTRLDENAFRRASLPFSGRWYARPEPQTLLPHVIQLVKNGALEDALELVKRGERHLKTGKEYPKFLVWLGEGFAQKGQTQTSLDLYRKALVHAPKELHAMNNLAWELAANPDLSIRNGKEAVRWAENAAQLTQHKNPAILDTLAAAYAQNGQFDKAVQTATTAIAQARAANNRALWNSLQNALKRYQAGQPHGG